VNQGDRHWRRYGFPRVPPKIIAWRADIASTIWLLLLR
jgi:hypothetical protein